MGGGGGGSEGGPLLLHPSTPHSLALSTPAHTRYSLTLHPCTLSLSTPAHSHSPPLHTLTPHPCTLSHSGPPPSPSFTLFHTTLSFYPFPLHVVLLHHHLSCTVHVRILPAGRLTSLLPSLSSSHLLLSSLSCSPALLSSAVISP